MSNADEIQQTIYTLLDDALRPLSTTEITEQTPYSKPTVLKYLKQLHTNDKIQQDQQGNTYYWYTGERDLF